MMAHDGATESGADNLRPAARAQPVDLLDALRDPAAMCSASPRCWSAILAGSRRYGLAGRWRSWMDDLGVESQLHPAVRDQLAADARLAARRVQALRWETTCVQRALAPLGIPLVLLKGAAYIALDLPGAGSRVSADLDILVPHDALAEVESAAYAHGWRSQVRNDYDEAYFRQWMHELPPMQHIVRGTVIDIHHNILPLTATLCPTPELLLEQARPVGNQGLSTLCPVDLVLHCAVHAFHDGELINPLRDTLDITEITRFYCTRDPQFWPRLTARARELKFCRPLAHALSAAERYFKLDVPVDVLTALWRDGGRGPFKPVVDWSLKHVMRQQPPAGTARKLAARLLQARAHVHKMPPGTLASHLAYKTWRRLRQKPAEAQTPTAT